MVYATLKSEIHSEWYPRYWCGMGLEFCIFFSFFFFLFFLFLCFLFCIFFLCFSFFCIFFLYFFSSLSPYIYAVQLHRFAYVHSLVARTSGSNNPYIQRSSVLIVFQHIYSQCINFSRDGFVNCLYLMNWTMHITLVGSLRDLNLLPIQYGIGGMSHVIINLYICVHISCCHSPSFKLKCFNLSL